MYFGSWGLRETEVGDEGNVGEAAQDQVRGISEEEKNPHIVGTTVQVWEWESRSRLGCPPRGAPPPRGTPHQEEGTRA
jgi:hypothetical protein